MPQSGAPEKIDFRIYIGMLFFRWQVIVVCFLYCLLGAVLYLQLSEKTYKASCRVNVYRDPNIPIGKGTSDWVAWKRHQAILSDARLRTRVKNRLADEWGDRVGSATGLALPVRIQRGNFTDHWVSARSVNRDYALAFLTELLGEYEKEWAGLMAESMRAATRTLEDELRRVESKIEAAQNAVIEFERLNDMARLSTRHAIEEAYVTQLVRRRHQLETELWMLDVKHPYLEDAGEGVVHDVHGLVREAVPVGNLDADSVDASGAPSVTNPNGSAGTGLVGDTVEEFDWNDYPRQWPELRVQRAQLEQQMQRLLEDLTPEHPRVEALKQKIAAVESDLEVAAEIEMNRLSDRRKALRVVLAAVESAEFKWQSRHTVARQKRAEWQRLQAVVNRYEQNYSEVYSRLHDARLAEEVKAERLHLGEVHAQNKPQGPDPGRILLIALALGLGSGLGIALVMQVTDNKVQTIGDVESELGITFLGGVPFWAHSGLEKAIRPIVTEENATGATEAYRALRTSLLAALSKINEKVVLVTSADSREGKTLTTLNIAIMIAQMNKKVLVVDMDLRRGRLHRSLGVAREPGMTDVLAKNQRMADAIQKTRIDNLSLMPTGAPVDNASELLQATDLVTTFADIQEDYDYVLVDTSPVLRVTDTVIAATQGLGVVVYVARVNKTAKPMIQYSLDMLRDGRVLGLIINSIEMHRLSSLYYAYQYPNYAYYSNAYVYGYNYHHDDGLFEQGGWGTGFIGNWHQRLATLGQILRRRLGGDES